MITLKRILFVLLLIALWIGCEPTDVIHNNVLQGYKIKPMGRNEAKSQYGDPIINDKVEIDCSKVGSGLAYVTVRVYAKPQDMGDLCHNLNINQLNPSNQFPMFPGQGLLREIPRFILNI